MYGEYKEQNDQNGMRQGFVQAAREARLRQFFTIYAPSKSTNLGPIYRRVFTNSLLLKIIISSKSTRHVPFSMATWKEVSESGGTCALMCQAKK